MMTDEQIQIVKSTAPLLAERGEELTKYFYKRMFEKHPQVRAFFNPAHQHSGHQQRALAAAICSYALYLDDLEKLTGAVEVIAHKHASLQVQAEHYPIVGEHLLASIQELFELEDGHPILVAWEAAYGVLADVLIGRERDIYQEQPDWTGFRHLRVSRREQESSEVVSLYLVSEEGALPEFRPGQYLTVRVPFPETGTTMRNYSLSCEPGREYYRISVKREPAHASGPQGYVSNYLHEQVNEGDMLEIARPCGEFVLEPQEGSERPLVLLAGGIGVTPLLSMAKAGVAKTPQRPIYFFQGARNSECHAFVNEVGELGQRSEAFQNRVYYSEPLEGDRSKCDGEGFLTLEVLQNALPGPDCDFYCCGPTVFMETMVEQLRNWGVSEERVHVEFFGPNQTLQSGETAAV